MKKIPTYDGTCVMVDEHGVWWARREVKPDKTPPDGFVEVERDELTGKTVGWEPADQAPFWRFLREAIGARSMFDFWPSGTYELVGPKVNGNPEGFDRHTLLAHADAEEFDDVPLDFDGLRDWLLDHKYEGIVWHNPDGRMAKLKKRDFRRSS